VVVTFEHVALYHSHNLHVALPMHGHKKVTQHLRSSNVAYVALTQLYVLNTPNTPKGCIFLKVHLKIHSAYVTFFLRLRQVAHENYTQWPPAWRSG
jgi:hypothetical protein